MKGKERAPKARALAKRRAPVPAEASPKTASVATVAVLEAPGRIQVVTRALRPLQRWEVLVRIRRAGICGTDLSLYSGEYPVPLPLVPGHEWVGVIEATGPGVDARLVGQRVVGEINLTCISREMKTLCPLCRRGLSNHCQTRDVMGIIRADGAWATHAIVPINNLHPVPPTVSDTHAVLVEPLAAAIQTFELCPIYPGFGVAILGAGRLGSLILQVAVLRGARTVAVSRSAAKRRRAKRLGAREVFAPGPNLAADLRSFFGGIGPDVVVEATGAPSGLAIAASIVRPRGTVCLKTTCGQSSPVNVTQIVVDEVQISASRCGPFDKALAMMRDGRLKLEPLIQAEFPLSQVTEAIRAASGIGKVLLKTDPDQA